MSAAPCFIQISDTHLVADTSLESYGVNPYENLERIIARISRLDPSPAFVMFTGDLISDDDPQSYRHLKLLTDRLPSPVHFGMGNHDLRRPFRHVVLGEESPGSEPHYYAFDTAGYHFVVLDSLVEGQVAGEAGRDSARLARCHADGQFTAADGRVYAPSTRSHGGGLAGRPPRSATGTTLLDILVRHRQVQRIFFGHVHMPIQITERGVQFSSVPSSAYQFGDTVTNPKVWPGSPGYGIVHLLEGKLSSRVVYL